MPSSSSVILELQSNRCTTSLSHVRVEKRSADPAILARPRPLRRAPASPSEPVKISVVTPTLDSARFLRACVASLRMQAAPGLEVEHLVADGGSTDGTVELADELGCTVVPVDPGAGIFAATNLATKGSSGGLVG